MCHGFTHLTTLPQPLINHINQINSAARWTRKYKLFSLFVLSFFLIQYYGSFLFCRFVIETLMSFVWQAFGAFNCSFFNYPNNDECELQM